MKKKIKLDNFKVTSFVTDSEGLNAQTIKGGNFSQGDPCTTNEPEFCNLSFNPWCVSIERCEN